MNNKEPMSKDDDTAANTFLFIIGAIFVASITAVITCCSEKIISEPIIHVATSSSNELFLSKLLSFGFFLTFYFCHSNI